MEPSSMSILFFCGKGGVGKTTTSAAAAIQYAQQGKKTRLTSLDPAHNLHDLFPGKISEKPRKIIQNLYVSETSPAYWEKKYLKQTKDEYNQVYRSKQAINVDKYFNILKFSPGIEEFTLLLALEDAVQQGGYDVLIIDTPPTALTLKILELPAKSLLWIENLMQLREEILQKKAIVEKIRGSETRSGKQDPILQRLIFLRRRYQSLQRILQDPARTTAHIVLNEDRLSRSESEEILFRLQELKIPVKSLLFNKSNQIQEMQDPRFQKLDFFCLPFLDKSPDTLESLKKINFPPI